MTSTLIERAPASTASSADRGTGNRSVVLAIILGTYLMIILDATIVVTALPKIHHALGFSPTGLSWVQNAYTLTFGGLLLLGARAGDIIGRRRVFVAGVALFTLCSLMGGLAQSATWLLVARAVQGVGAAIAAPSTLALLQTSFPEGEGRARAVAAYSAVAGGGGSVGLVVGGMLTSWVSWRWGLFINVPIGIVLATLAPRFLPETPRRPGHFDIAGAATSTLGMATLVYGFVRAAGDGWGNPVSIGSFIAAAVLLSAFVRIEVRAEQPITPLRLFTSRQRVGALGVRMLAVGGMFAMFFFLTQFFQGVLRYSPIKAGIAFLPATLVMFGAVRFIPRIALKVGNFRLLSGGLLTALIGMAWLSRITAETAYFPRIAIPMVLLGLGIGTALMPLTTAAIAGVAPEDAGAASGLVNVAQQLGGSVGLGILVTVFSAASRDSAHLMPAAQLAHAVASSLTGSAIFLALALMAVLVTMRPAPAPESVAAPSEAGSGNIRVEQWRYQMNEASESAELEGLAEIPELAEVVTPEFATARQAADVTRKCS